MPPRLCSGRPVLRLAITSSLLITLSTCSGQAMLVTANDPVSLIAASPHVVSARGGTAVTITGLGFSPATTVLVEGAPVSSVLVSPTELRFTTPPLFSGRAKLLVVEGAEWQSELLGGLEVLPLELRFVEAPPHSLAMPATPLTTAATADIDGDGDGDLLTCGTTCSFWFNDGRGNFDALEPDAGSPLPALPPGARFLALEDFDVDGAPDLLFAFADGGAVYRNLGGRFEGPSEWRLPAGTVATARGDLDGDGRMDLVSANGSELHVAFNTSGMQFSERDAGPLSLPPTRALTLADVNGDGELDVIAATIAVHQGVALRLFLNSGGVLTEVPGGLPGGPVQPVTALAAADVDGDHVVDLICVGAGQDRLLLNDGAAHFFDATSTLLPVDGSNGTSVALVDLDRDRDVDLLIGNAGATTRLYVNDGAGRFIDRTPLLPVRAETIAQVASADVDGDGDWDLLVLPSMADQAHLYLSVEPAP
ncbi:MAG: FG-GAP-like repeat-containing protein [Archangium sp.]|nr:FG-GAP-like repeat-containing protein [Archangium sp.]